ncbi:PAS domain-containing sensor histidine kinase [Bacteroidota bacterium]
MISKNLNIQIILRILMLVVAAIGLAWIIFGPMASILAIIPIIVLIAASIELSFFLNRVNRRLFYFFEAIKNEDSTLSFPLTSNNKMMKDLNLSLVKVNKQIQQIYFENQKQELYFQALIEHAASGMFTFNKEGFILHSNKLAKQLFGVEVLTHLSQLEAIDSNLYQTVKEMKSSEQRLTAVNFENGIVQLLIKANSFISDKEELMLLSVHDIKTQLDEKELDSWHKLIRVMMHEIMNSITPITSLSESVAGYFYTGKKLKTPEQIDSKTIETTLRGLEVIREQGKNLESFVESYHKLSRLPKPEKKVFAVQNLIDNIRILSESFPNAENIYLECKVEPEDQKLLADEKQISQVLINLVKNAFQACTNIKGARVKIRVSLGKNGRQEIKVIDNGSGIPDELLDKVFIPFFTTKETGSGIGLSVSRQIMQDHGGSLKIVSLPGKETTAVLSF